MGMRNNTIFKPTKTNNMKPIIKQEQQDTTDTILTSDIKYKHIVVAINPYKVPTILSKPFDESGRELTFLSVAEDFTNGNGYPFSYNEDTIESMVNYAINTGWNVAVYPQSEWKAALKWLIDNA
jgi:hypothetical protein